MRSSLRGSGNKWEVQSVKLSDREQFIPSAGGASNIPMPLFRLLESSWGGTCRPRHVASLSTEPLLSPNPLLPFWAGKKETGKSDPWLFCTFPFWKQKVVFGHFREIWNSFTFEKQLIVREKDCQAVNQTMVLAVWFILHIGHAMLR